LIKYLWTTITERARIAGAAEVLLQAAAISHGENYSAQLLDGLTFLENIGSEAY
jgi:hypothetical protein